MKKITKLIKITSDGVNISGYDNYGNEYKLVNGKLILKKTNKFIFILKRIFKYLYEKK